MRFSTFHLFSQSPGQSEDQVYNREIEMIRWADELGFDTAWVAEHHFRPYGIVPNVMLLLGYLAGITRQIHLGSAIVIAPFHNPLRAAEDAAMVDRLSGGRLRYGFGRGYHGYEYHGFGLHMEDNRAVTDETMAIMRKAWTGAPFRHEGEHFRVPEVRVIPTPIQQPIPETVASISEESVAHYGRQGISFLVDITLTTEQLRDLCALWAREASANGIDPRTANHVVMRLVNVTETTEEARQLALRGHPVGYAATSAQVYDPFLAFKDAPTAQERFALDSAPIDPETGKIAKGYEYWEKGYLGKGPAAFDPSTEESWNGRWVAGDLPRVKAKLDELEAMGIAEVITVFAAANPARGETYLEAVHREMRKFSAQFIVGG